MTQRPDRQPEDVGSPLVPAADPDLDSGEETTSESDSERANEEADRDKHDDDVR